MNSWSGKGVFTSLEVIPVRRATHSRRGLLTGFTLVEILVAVAIIATIVSMVYGSYFATSRSAQAYQARTSLFQQCRKVLNQMARQIRGSYAGTTEKQTDTDSAISWQRKKMFENPNDYFGGGPDDPSGEILHIVTTNGIFCSQDQTGGLFDATYKFDKSAGVLFVSQRRFINTSENVVEKQNWRPVLRNVKSVELAFFDGQQWIHSWDFKNKKTLPCAVKVNISCEDKIYQQHHFGTIAYVSCRQEPARKTQPDTLVSFNKQ